MTDDQAWAAGLFDGEGSVSHDRLQLKMVDLPTVERFHEIVECGDIYGPYPNRTGEKDGYPRSDFYVWIARREDRFAVAHLLYPLLSQVRRDAIDHHYGELVPLEDPLLTETW